MNGKEFLTANVLPNKIVFATKVPIYLPKTALTHTNRPNHGFAFHREGPKTYHFWDFKDIDIDVDTVIYMPKGEVEKTLVRGVARDNDVARVAVCNLKDEPGIAFKIFSHLAKKGINVDIILQSIGREGYKDISFTVTEDNAQKVEEILMAEKEYLGFEDIKISTQFAKVSIVGSGMVNNPGVASVMFEALYDANINIHMISTSEIKVSVLVNKNNADAAVRAIHAKFNLA